MHAGQPAWYAGLRVLPVPPSPAPLFAWLHCRPASRSPMVASPKECPRAARQLRASPLPANCQRYRWAVYQSAQPPGQPLLCPACPRRHLEGLAQCCSAPPALAGTWKAWPRRCSAMAARFMRALRPGRQARSVPALAPGPALPACEQCTHRSWAVKPFSTDRLPLHPRLSPLVEADRVETVDGRTIR